MRRALAPARRSRQGVGDRRDEPTKPQGFNAWPLCGARKGARMPAGPRSASGIALHVNMDE